MCINKIVIILKIIEDNRFWMVGLENLLLALQESEVIHVHDLEHQLNIIDQVNWIVALTLRVSIIGTQWHSFSSSSLFMNSLWLGYFLLKGVCLQTDIKNSTWILVCVNQLLLCGDIFNSENMNQAFHLTLYALGYLGYSRFLKGFSQGILSGAMIGYVMLQAEKIRNYPHDSYFLYQWLTFIGLPVITYVLLQNHREGEFGIYWLMCIMFMSFMEYHYVKKDNGVEVVPQTYSSPV